MSEKSVMAANQNAGAAHVLSSIETHGGELVEALWLCNQELPKAERIGKEALRGFVLWLANVLAQRKEALGDAEQGYVDERGDDPAVWAERDEAAVEVYEIAMQGRARIAKVFGSEVPADYGMSEPPPFDTVAALAEYGDTAAELLRAKPRVGRDGFGARFAVADVLAPLSAALSRLRLSLDAVRREKRELGAAMRHRNQVYHSQAEGDRAIAGAIAGLYRLGGLHALAVRVRPAARRGRGEVRPGGLEPAATTAPGGARDEASGDGLDNESAAAGQSFLTGVADPLIL